MVELLQPVASFSSHLDTPSVIDARTGGSYELRAVQVLMNLGLGNGPDGMPLLTPMWTYQRVGEDEAAGAMAMSGMDMSGMASDHDHGGLGAQSPTILASTDVPLSVVWSNALPAQHLLPVDDSIMAGMGGHDMGAMSGAMAMGHEHDSGEVMPGMDGGMGEARDIPVVTHLHGGHTAAIYDGFPSQAITQGQERSAFIYDNDQQGALLWYHDHAMGMTRLNVYAGLAGTYVIEDDNRRALVEKGVLPETLGGSDLTLMLQDKAFTADGKLYYPGASAEDPLPGTDETVGDVLPPDYDGPFPTAVPEFFGNVLLVNGQAWPHAHVGHGEVEYDLVNGSDSRFYVLKLDNPWIKVTLLGTDGGLLEKPVTIMDGDGVDEPGEQLVLAPADRLQLMFDFSDPHIANGEKVHLLNAGPAYEPFKGLLPDGSLQPGREEDGSPAPVQAATPSDPVGQIVEFRVTDAVAAWHSTLTPDTVLNPDLHLPVEADATVTRRLGIFEVEDGYGRIMPMVGVAEKTTDIAGHAIDGVANPFARGFDAPVTEVVKLGATEVWEFFNTTEDAHPVHVHQGQFRVLGRYHIADADTDGDGVSLNDGYQNDLGKLIDTRDDLPGVQNLYAEDGGAQDTVWVGPGEAVKIVMTFDRPGDYVWHCHILSHEDHDMMRAFKVVGVAGDFSGATSEDAAAPLKGLLEIGEVDPLQQGFRPETLHGRYGTLTLADNLVLDRDADGMKVAPVHANNGEWSFTASCAAQSLGAGESKVEHFKIHELDGNALDIAVTITGENDAPTVCGPVDLGRACGPLTITAAQLLARAHDLDAHDTLAVKGLHASSGRLVDKGDGAWTFTPDGHAKGLVTFTYEVSDGLEAVDAAATLALGAGRPAHGTPRHDGGGCCDGGPQHGPFAHDTMAFQPHVLAKAKHGGDHGDGPGHEGLDHAMSEPCCGPAHHAEDGLSARADPWGGDIEDGSPSSFVPTHHEGLMA